MLPDVRVVLDLADEELFDPDLVLWDRPAVAIDRRHGQDQLHSLHHKQALQTFLFCLLCHKVQSAEENQKSTDARSRSVAAIATKFVREF